jgi:hypothetical protein
MWTIQKNLKYIIYTGIAIITKNIILLYYDLGVKSQKDINIFKFAPWKLNTNPVFSSIYGII